LLYTDYNYIPINLSTPIPENSFIERIKEERNKNSSFLKKIKDFHKKIYQTTYKYNPYLGNSCDEFIEEIIIKQDESQNFRIISRFSSILYMKYFQYNCYESSLLVIENDWTKILKDLPKPVYKYSYGN